MSTTEEYRHPILHEGLRSIPPTTWMFRHVPLFEPDSTMTLFQHLPMPLPIEEGVFPIRHDCHIQGQREVSLDNHHGPSSGLFSTRDFLCMFQRQQRTRGPRTHRSGQIRRSGTLSMGLTLGTRGRHGQNVQEQPCQPRHGGGSDFGKTFSHVWSD